MESKEAEEKSVHHDSTSSSRAHSSVLVAEQVGQVANSGQLHGVVLASERHTQVHDVASRSHANQRVFVMQ